MSITSWVLDPSRSLIFSTALVNNPDQGNIGVFGKEAENQPSHEVIHVRPPIIVAHSGFSLSSSTYSLLSAPSRTNVDGVVLNLSL